MALLDGDGFPIYQFDWWQAKGHSGLWIGAERQGRAMSGVLWDLDSDPVIWRVVEVARDWKVIGPINEESWPTLIKAKSAAERYMISLLVVEALSQVEL